MAKASTIDRLPEEVRLEIGRLRQNGRSIDEILAHLRRMDGIAPVSRSALGRHLQRAEKIGDRLRHTRQVTEVLAKELGDAPDSKAARLAIELMQNEVLDIFLRAAEAEDSGDPKLGDNPQGVMFLAKSLESLARASKTNIDFIAAAEKRSAERAKREAATAVEVVARERGLSGETLDAIKAGIFGVKVSA